MISSQLPPVQVLGFKGVQRQKLELKYDTFWKAYTAEEELKVNKWVKLKGRAFARQVRCMSWSGAQVRFCTHRVRSRHACLDALQCACQINDLRTCTQQLQQG